MPTAEIYRQAKIERLWISRLRALGDDVFQNIIRRILRGDAIREIAFYCHKINPQYLPNTYRGWLHALEQQADGPISKYREQDHAQKAIEEFNKEKAKRNSLVAQADVEPPSYEVMRRLHRNVNKETKRLNTGMMIQYLWYAAQKRLDKMMDLEERMGVQMPNGYKNIAVLNKIAETSLRYELGMSILMRKSGEGSVLDINTLDPAAQEFSKLDDVDRNIIHNLRQRFVKMIAEEANESTTGLEPNAGTAEATREANSSGPDSESKSPST